MVEIMQANKKNYSFLSGFIPSLLLPIPTFFSVGWGLTLFSDITYSEFLFVFLNSGPNFTVSILSLCIVSSLLVFYFFYSKKQLIAQRGAVAAIFIYVFVILFLKLSAE